MSMLLIGKIINTRGLKGEVKIENHSSFIKDRYKVNNIVYLSDDEKNFKEFKINHFNYTKGFVYLFLDGIDNIDMANKYRNYSVYCSDEVLNENKDVYHLNTLKELDVVFNGRVIGKIVDIESNGRQDLVRIDTGNKSFLVPFLHEFIKEINRDKKYIEFTGIEVFYEN